MSKVAEKYSRAVRSSHLEMSAIEPGDLDLLIAAGTLRDGIGPSLLRLRAEKDSISKLPGARLASRALRTMAGARSLLIHYASHYSEHPADGIELRNIVDSVLDLWLEPNCVSCGGTGKKGAYGSPQAMCAACRGSTKREVFWPTQQSERLAYWLLGKMDEKMGEALRRIAYLMRNE